ncbi:ATP-grasp domain-containing protein [Paraburkholderia humisilvae]|uniref:ATP-grasp domain-containing protein n=1 Tax=Paraburkholderia humisilvae TaxID=627669 RepID=A0A6J5F9Z8_9BURK|nr:ATP-grasp domain-containing protein [Paraburkholderia humisilvae]CAB3774472.1 hypothetical protein LMG29542_07849 [Paraburkholderia humisilvae]
MSSTHLIVTLDGIDAQQGAAQLRKWGKPIHWFDRSEFLAETAQPGVPEFRAHRRVHYAGMPVLSGHRDLSGFAVTFAPEDDHAERPWQHHPALRLLASDGAAVAFAADKLSVLRLFDDARVRYPIVLTVPGGNPRLATEIWHALGNAPVVVQRRENNLIGRGTWLAKSPRLLADRLRQCTGHELRVSRYIEGLAVTVTACITSQDILVSGLSHQLVGIPTLGASWGAHCGNQLLHPDELPVGAADEIQQAGRRVGSALRTRGYLGTFGLDWIVDPTGAVYAIEINPRFQTVVSIVQAQEITCGLMPTLGTHVLALGGNPCLPRVERSGRFYPLSQFVMHAPRDGVIASTISSGCYRLDGRQLYPIPDRPLIELTDHEARVWVHAPRGAQVHTGDETMLVQFAHRISPLTSRGKLHADATRWISALSPQFKET